MYNELILFFEKYHISLIIGAILGVLLGIVITNIYFRITRKLKSQTSKKESITDKAIGVISTAFRKWPMETIIVFITGIFIVSQLVLAVFNIVLSSSSLGVIINFFTSIIFSWLLTKYSSEREFNERQKETAIRSYRHSLNIKNKLLYDIKVVELLSLDIEDCGCNKDGNCELKHHMKRATDFLVAAHEDSVENMNDWGDILSDELNRIKEIEDINKLLLLENIKIQECDPVEEKDEIHISNIAKARYTKQLSDLKNKLNSKVRYSIENRKNDENKFLSQIQDEIDIKKTNIIQKEVGKEININLKEKVQKTR